MQNIHIFPATYITCENGENQERQEVIARTFYGQDVAPTSAHASRLSSALIGRGSRGGDLLPWLRSGILAIDGCLDLRNFLPLLVHGIRLQRNVLAHVSPEGVPIHIAIEVVPVVVSLEATAVAGHLFDELGDVFRNSIGSRRFAFEQRGRERLGTGTPRDRLKDASLGFARAQR
jgi:hypothetical protein